MKTILPMNGAKYIGEGVTSVTEPWGFCALCMKKFDGVDVVASAEHILPKSIGGKLKWRGICTKCNSKLGEEVDSVFEKNLLIRLAKWRYNISGSGIKPIRNIFDGAKGSIGDFKIPFDGSKGDSPNITRKVSVEFNDDDDFIIKAGFSLDSTERERKGYILSAVLKEWKKRHPNASEEEIKGLKNRVFQEIDNIIGEYCTETDVCINEKIDIANMVVFFYRLAYEMACFVFGENYAIESETANKLRLAINKRDWRAPPGCALMPKDESARMMFDLIDREHYSYIMLLDGTAVMSVLGINAMVRYEESNPKFKFTGLDTPIYFFNILKDETCIAKTTRMSFAEYAKCYPQMTRRLANYAINHPQ